MFVCANEGSLFGTDLEADGGELVIQVPVSFDCLLGHLVGRAACCVIANVINPAG